MLRDSGLGFRVLGLGVDIKYFASRDLGIRRMATTYPDSPLRTVLYHTLLSEYNQGPILCESLVCCKIEAIVAEIAASRLKNKDPFGRKLGPFKGFYKGVQKEFL